MRLHLITLSSLLAAAPPATAQTPAGHAGWHLGGGVEAVRFGHVAVSGGLPGTAAEIRPSPRSALHLSAGRTLGPWAVGLEAGWAGGHVEAANDAVSVQDRTSDVSRYRLAMGVERRVAAAGRGNLGVVLAPTLDLWTVGGANRVRAGAEARLVLRVALGSVALENRLAFGLSGNPVEAGDIGEVSELRGLRTVSVGIGLRFGL